MDLAIFIRVFFFFLFLFLYVHFMDSYRESAVLRYCFYSFYTEIAPFYVCLCCVFSFIFSGRFILLCYVLIIYFDNKSFEVFPSGSFSDNKYG